MKRRVLAGVSIALVLGTAVAANAAWTKTGTGTGSATARSLADATSPSVTRLSATSARVAWTNGSNPAGTRYKVVRSVGTGSPATICASATTSPCDDTTASGASVSYTIQTFLPSTNWTRTAINAGSVTLTATTYILSMTSSSAVQNTSNWRATVNMTLVDNTGTALSGYIVTGSWSVGSGTGCTTVANGTCSDTTGNIGNANTSSTFTVSTVTKSGNTLTKDATSQTTVVANKP